MLGVWEHMLTGEVFETYEKTERKQKGGYERKLYMKYLFSYTKYDHDPFPTRTEFLKRMLNFGLIQEVLPLPQ